MHTHGKKYLPPIPHTFPNETIYRFGRFAAHMHGHMTTIQHTHSMSIKCALRHKFFSTPIFQWNNHEIKFSFAQNVSSFGKLWQSITGKHIVSIMSFCVSHIFPPLFFCHLLLFTLRNLVFLAPNRFYYSYYFRDLVGFWRQSVFKFYPRNLFQQYIT